MLEDIKKDIEKLVSLYETEREKRLGLQAELDRCKTENDDCRRQIADLKRQVDNLQLTEAFASPSGKNPEAKEKIDKLIREIDRCISLLEK
jgi:septal ring factor EnvC (AmiA/AmiB activator)